MRYACLLFVLFLAVLSPLFARAEVIYMKDGTTREGTIIHKAPDSLQLRINRDGMTATVSISMADVDRIEQSKPAPSTTAPAPAPATRTAAGLPPDSTHTAATAPASQPKVSMEKSPLRTGSFVTELAAAALGFGPDNPERLPKNLRDLWDNAIRLDKLGNAPNTLAALQALNDAFEPLPHGIERLNGMTQRDHQESFGQWLARIHYDVLVANIRGTQLDFADIREAERAPLAGLLKEKAAPALDALKSYFPPIDEKTGRYGPFQATQLTGITITNAIDVKQQATLALALLLGQIKLEPELPFIDRAALNNQAVIVRRILAKASELEPAARRELAKQKPPAAAGH